MPASRAPHVNPVAHLCKGSWPNAPVEVGTTSPDLTAAPVVPQLKQVQPEAKRRGLWASPHDATSESQKSPETPS